MRDYVALTGPTDGATAAGACERCLRSSDLSAKVEEIEALQRRKIAKAGGGA